MSVLKELYDFREMLISLVKRDIRSKYKGSFLGYLWTLLNPLLQLLVYTLVFGTIFGNSIENFPLFLFIGLIPWNNFTASLNAATTIVVGSAGLIKKIYFPKLVLPIKVVASNTMDQLFASIIIVVSCVLVGVGVSWHILLFPAILCLQVMLMIGMCAFLSALYTKFRDLAYVVNFATMLWFYVTPIIYTGDNFVGLARLLILLNPMTTVVNSYRSIFLYHSLPSFASFAYLFVVSIASLLVGVFVFKKLERGFAEEI